MQSSHGSELDQDVIIRAPLRSSDVTGVQDEPTAGQNRTSPGNNPWTALSPALHNAYGGPRGTASQSFHRYLRRDPSVQIVVSSVEEIREKYNPCPRSFSGKATQSSSRRIECADTLVFCRHAPPAAGKLGAFPSRFNTSVVNF
jgi:hypothetical protein